MLDGGSIRINLDTDNPVDLKCTYLLDAIERQEVDMLARLPLHDMTSHSIIVLSDSVHSCLESSLFFAINFVHKNKQKSSEKRTDSIKWY